MAAMISELTTLDEVLTYYHPGVIRRYCNEQGVSYAVGEEHFREVLKWLYLCYRHAIEQPEGFVCSMHPEILQLDEMWHCFVLYTLDYAEFCEKFLVSSSTSPKTTAGPELTDAEIAANSCLFSFVHDVQEKKHCTGTSAGMPG